MCVAKHRVLNLVDNKPSAAGRRRRRHHHHHCHYHLFLFVNILVDKRNS